jgi:hypothetical protein
MSIVLLSQSPDPSPKFSESNFGTLGDPPREGDCLPPSLDSSRDESIEVDRGALIVIPVSSRLSFMKSLRSPWGFFQCQSREHFEGMTASLPVWESYKRSGKKKKCKNKKNYLAF